jgi:acetylglutamate synthase
MTNQSVLTKSRQAERNYNKISDLHLDSSQNTWKPFWGGIRDAFVKMDKGCRW